MDCSLYVTDSSEKYLNLKVFILYNAILYPYLSYGIVLLGSSYKTYLKGIEVLQKKVVRPITNIAYNANT